MIGARSQAVSRFVVWLGLALVVPHVSPAPRASAAVEISCPDVGTDEAFVATRRQAERLFERAEQARAGQVPDDSQGLYLRSRRLFACCHSVRPSARTWSGLGLTAYRLGRDTEAFGHLREALNDAREPLPPAQRSNVERLLEWLSNRVGVVYVEVSPPDAGIRVDGHAEMLGPGQSLVLDVGRHTLAVEAKHHVTGTRDLQVFGGGSGKVSISLERVPLWRRYTKTFVGAGLTAATAVAGAWSHHAVERQRRERVDTCLEEYECGRVESFEREYQSRLRRSQIVLGVSAAFAVGTLVLAIVEAHQGEWLATRSRRKAARRSVRFTGADLTLAF